MSSFVFNSGDHYIEEKRKNTFGERMQKWQENKKYKEYEKYVYENIDRKMIPASGVQKYIRKAIQLNKEYSLSKEIAITEAFKDLINENNELER